MKNTDRPTLKTAFIKTLPILCSYIFVGSAYGLTMAENGFEWYYSVMASALVYTGAFQFILVSFLSGGTPLLTVLLTALLMNSRLSFYGLTFLDDFKRAGKRKLYMIHAMSDETYALDCTLGETPRGEREKLMFLIALLSQFYWIAGTGFGALLGNVLPIELEGIDFCMTALFVTICIDQWEKASEHLPALSGLVIGVLCLIVFGKGSFMLPALLLTSALLIVVGGRRAKA